MCGFISGIAILLYWSIFLSLGQYHTVLMTVALCYSLKSVRWVTPVPFFFLKTALAILGFLYFHTNCEIIFCSSVKNTTPILMLLGITTLINIGHWDSLRARFWENKNQTDSSQKEKKEKKQTEILEKLWWCLLIYMVSKTSFWASTD